MIAKINITRVGPSIDIGLVVRREPRASKSDVLNWAQEERDRYTMALEAIQVDSDHAGEIAALALRQVETDGP